MRPRDTGFSRKRIEPSSSRKGDSGSNYFWGTPMKSSSRNWEFSRSMSNKGFSSKSEDVAAPDEIMNEDLWNRRDRDTQKPSRWEKISSNSEIGSWNSHSVARSESFSTAALESPMASRSAVRSETFSGTALNTSVAAHSVVRSGSFSGVVSESSSGPPLTGAEPTAGKISETDKMWHYKDPSGRVQGPFSLIQLRKWSNSGYFPKDLRIWRTNESQDESTLLTDVLFAAFPKDSSHVDNSIGKSQNLHPLRPSTDSGKPYESTLQQAGENQTVEKSDLDHRGENWRAQLDASSSRGWVASSMVEAPKLSINGLVSDHNNSHDSVNLPSPTPGQSTTGWVAGQAPEKQSTGTEFPVQSASDLFPGSSGTLPSPTKVSSENGQLIHSSTSPSSVKQVAGVDTFCRQTSDPGGKEHDMIEVLGALVPSSVSNSSANAPDVLPKSSAPGESQSVHPLPAPDLAAGSMNPGAIDSKIAGACFPSLVHSVLGHSHPVEIPGWGSGAISKPEIVASCSVSGGESQTWGYGPPQKLERNNSMPMHSQQPICGPWVDAASIHNTSSLGTGNLPGYFPNTGLGLPPSDSWRPQVPSNPPNFQPQPPGNLGPSLPNLAPNFPPNMGPRAPHSLGSLAPTNLGHPTPLNLGPLAPPNLNPQPPQILAPPGPPNMISATPPNLVPLGPPNLIPPGPPNMIPPPQPGMMPPAAPPNLGPAAPRPGPQNPNAGWGPMPGNPNLSWAPVPVSTNMNWGASGQTQPTGNTIPGWVAPAGNPGMWGSDQNHNGDRFSGQRDGGSQGGDPGYGGGRPWNRQSSFGNNGGGGGGGSGRSTPKGQRMCVYHESGHCKKGASCDYRHS